MIVRFNFKPDDNMLNPHYQRLEHCINEMNKVNNIDAVNHWALEAHKAVCKIWEVNCNVIDIMGGGLT